MADPTLAWISLAALALVILSSFTTRLNPGILSIVLASVIGGLLAPKIGVKAVLAGFPSDLFLTLTGVTLLFTLAQVNGTLERVAAVAVRGCRGKASLMPVAFFVLSFGLASIGPGNIAATALLAPMAMATAQRAAISALLMAIMISHGALAGGMSPFAPTGVIAQGIMGKTLGIAGVEWRLYLDNLLANLVVATTAYLLLGRRLFARGDAPQQRGAPETEAPPSFKARHGVTLGIIVLLVVAVAAFNVPVGVAAFGGVVVVSLLGIADENEALKKMPWGVMLMVCGVTVLTALLEKTGGSELLIKMVGRVSGERTVTGVIAFLTGLVSVYSSTSGVVLPAFLPLTPGIAREVGGDPMSIASSIIVGGHLVDSSPLSTLGALCLACAPAAEDRRRVFNRLLLWGLSMTLVGALWCFVAYGML
jgi:Na+/H+ antiporter NhaD/arsenite permease-like protein